MTTTAPTAASLATHKKRQRREAKIREQYDRISAALLNTDSTRFAARNPTRVIPAVPGFETLSKAEIKKDYKEIERGTLFVHLSREHHLEKEEELVQGIERSFFPSCEIESTLLKKYQRLNQWIKQPELKDKEITYWKEKCNEIRQQRFDLEKESNDWITSFNVVRKAVMEAVIEVQDDNKKLRNQCKALQALCENECAATSKMTTTSTTTATTNLVAVPPLPSSQPSATTTTSTSSCPTNRELLEELEHREEEMEMKIEDFRLVAQSSGLTTVLPRSSLPPELTTLLFPFATDVTATTAATTGVDVKKDDLVEERPRSHDEERALAIKRMTAYMNNLDDQLRLSETHGDLGDIDSSFFDKEVDLSIIYSITGKRPLNGSGGGAGMIKSEDGSTKISKEEVLQAFSLLTTQQAWIQYINGVLDPTAIAMQLNGSGMRKKRRVTGVAAGSGANATEPLHLLSHCRQRMERGVRVLYSPVSVMEDRFLASEMIQLPEASCSGLHAMLPSEITMTENAYMARCLSHSAASALLTEVAHMQHEVNELNKILLDAQSARNKAESLYRQTIVEDETEKLRIRQELAYYGLIDEKLGGVEGLGDHFLVPLLAVEPGSGNGGNKKPNGRRSSGGGRGGTTSTSVSTNGLGGDDSSSLANTSSAVEKEGGNGPVSKRRSSGVNAAAAALQNNEVASVASSKRRR